MKEKVEYLKQTAYIILLMIVNLYMGIHLIEHLKDFKSNSAPICVEEVIKKDPPRFAGTLDVDDDGEDEVVFSRPYHIANQQEISVFEPLQKDFVYHHYGEILVPLNYVFFDAYYNQEWKINVFRFLEFKGGIFRIVEVDNRQYQRKTIPLEKLNIDLSTQKIDFYPPTLVDLEDDGRLEMVIIFSSPDKPYTRGIVCFDHESGGLLWDYYAGTKITGAQFTNLDGQGGKEIILSSFAANNDVTVNGTSDAFSYVIVLDSKGKLCWKRKVDYYYTFTRIAVADLDHDGIAEIVTSTERHHTRLKEKGVIIVFDGLTGEYKKTTPLFSVSFSQPFIRSFAKDDTRIYVGDSAGYIRMFDRELKELKKIEANIPVHVLNNSTSTSSSTPFKQWHYVYAQTQDQFLVYNRELTARVFSNMFEQPPEGGDSETGIPSFMMPIHTKQRNYALLKADRVYLVRESVLSFKEILKIMVTSGLLPGIIFLLLFNGFFIYFFYRMKVSNDHRSGRKVSPEMAKFLEIVQGIAQKLKNPISSVLWAAEKIRDSAQDRENIDKKKSDSNLQLADFLTDDAEKMRRQTDHLLRLVQIYNPRLEQKHLKPILQNLVDHYHLLVEEKIEIYLEMVEDISLLIDEELVKEALANLIDNAVDAMTQGGKLRISAVPVASPSKEDISHVLIEVEDTGIGMEEEEVSQIFTQFFSKKEGGSGIGLTICKRIIEAHGGNIDVHSRKGFGTKIAVIIPKGK
jgi:signal transduction histidine kinase